LLDLIYKNKVAFPKLHFWEISFTYPVTIDLKGKSPAFSGFFPKQPGLGKILWDNL
jgi:hypothetical protein